MDEQSEEEVIEASNGVPTGRFRVEEDVAGVAVLVHADSGEPVGSPAVTPPRAVSLPPGTTTDGDDESSKMKGPSTRPRCS